MRCESCNQFCSAEQAEPEVDASIQEVSVEEGIVVVTGVVELRLESACCGSDVGSASPDFDMTINFAHAEGCLVTDEGEDTVSLDDVMGEATDRYQTTDRERQADSQPALSAALLRR